MKCSAAAWTRCARRMKKRALLRKYPRALELERLLLQTGVKAGKAVVGGADVKEELLKLKEANQAQQKELRGIFERAGVPEDYLQPHFYCKTVKTGAMSTGNGAPVWKPASGKGV